MKIRSGIIVILALILAVSGAGAYDILSGLVVNYTDFSYVNSIAVGYDYVYFGTTGGIIRYHIGDERWIDPMSGIDNFPVSNIKEIRVSRDDNLIWVRTESGLYEYVDTFERWFPIDQFPDEAVNGSHRAPDFDYIPPAGYNYFNDGALVDLNNRKYPLTDVLDDGWNNLWIGTWGLGALRADVSARRMEIIAFGLVQEDVSTIYRDGDRLWFGGKDYGYYRSGLTVFDWRANEFEYIIDGSPMFLRPENINAIDGNREYIFVGTDDGLMVIDRDEMKVTDHLYIGEGLPGNRVRSLLAFGDTLAIGSEFGLALIDFNTDSTETTKVLKTLLEPLSILSLARYEDDLWIGSEKGAYRFNLATGKIGRLNIPEITTYGEVRDIELGTGEIWLATEDNLVAIDLETAAVSSFPSVNSYGGVRAVAVSDTLAAAATRDGLLLFYNGRRAGKELFTTNDGLLSNQINDLVFDGEYIWIGSDRGLSRFWYRSPALFH